MMERQVKTPVRIKKMPNPKVTWRLRSAAEIFAALTGGGGVVFLFLVELAIGARNGIKLQYSKSRKNYLVVIPNLFCLLLL